MKLEEKPSIMDLPDELKIEIFKHLPKSDIFKNVALVCKEFYRVSQDSKLVTELCFNNLELFVLENQLQNLRRLQTLRKQTLKSPALNNESGTVDKMDEFNAKLKEIEKKGQKITLHGIKNEDQIDPFIEKMKLELSNKEKSVIDLVRRAKMLTKLTIEKSRIAELLVAIALKDRESPILRELDIQTTPLSKMCVSLINKYGSEIRKLTVIEMGDSFPPSKQEIDEDKEDQSEEVISVEIHGQNFEFQDRKPVPREPLKLPKLTHLTIRGPSFSPNLHLIGQHCPLLEHLDIPLRDVLTLGRETGREEGITENKWRRFIFHRKSSLKSLIFNEDFDFGESLRSSELTNCLRELKNCEVLSKVALNQWVTEFETSVIDFIGEPLLVKIKGFEFSCNGFWPRMTIFFTQDQAVEILDVDMKHTKFDSLGARKMDPMNIVSRFLRHNLHWVIAMKIPACFAPVLSEDRFICDNLWSLKYGPCLGIENAVHTHCINSLFINPINRQKYDRLHKLDVSQFSNHVFYELIAQNCPNLGELSINIAELKDAARAFEGRAVTLKYCDQTLDAITELDLSPESNDNVRLVPNLENGLLDAISRHCPSMEKLKIKPYCLDFKALVPLQNLQKLKSLTLTNVKKNVTPNDWNYFFQTFKWPFLKELTFNFCSGIDESVLESIVTRYPNLESFNLIESDMSDTKIRKVEALSKFKNLKSLHLAVKHVNFKQWMSLFQNGNWESLEYLNLLKCNGILRTSCYYHP